MSRANHVLPTILPHYLSRLIPITPIIVHAGDCSAVVCENPTKLLQEPRKRAAVSSGSVHVTNHATRTWTGLVMSRDGSRALRGSISRGEEEKTQSTIFQLFHFDIRFNRYGFIIDREYGPIW